ncbi:uncharacterized protein SPPG_00120 [Spizellomyces punctatus DAOM BR117]|uniref:Integrator complex subunit 5 C-terminal domain-containing protein n=1 Tax=Spizellomyces punctatus (strain DAOM BR117) TaxID=645134 RepID=A0A0L0HU36_SPIPD|nr:uncharacterized protein SPPG_00120 [Spizellomyces punctatus DAOM BR117]KND04389.1 hypothetical protein SPPG_00120 [Spizellomyces punctatus DAOM BR117]|eukprot:XP_016612428.1 hypothetical protein SPPG_00120 [Spizellomyces punctatus DAOM BR117]
MMESYNKRNTILENLDKAFVLGPLDTLLNHIFSYLLTRWSPKVLESLKECLDVYAARREKYVVGYLVTLTVICPTFLEQFGNELVEMVGMYVEGMCGGGQVKGAGPPAFLDDILPPYIHYLLTKHPTLTPPITLLLSRASNSPSSSPLAQTLLYNTLQTILKDLTQNGASPLLPAFRTHFTRLTQSASQNYLCEALWILCIITFGHEAIIRDAHLLTPSLLGLLDETNLLNQTITSVLVSLDTYPPKTRTHILESLRRFTHVLRPNYRLLEPHVRDPVTRHAALALWVGGPAEVIETVLGIWMQVREERGICEEVVKSMEGEKVVYGVLEWVRRAELTSEEWSVLAGLAGPSHRPLLARLFSKSLTHHPPTPLGCYTLPAMPTTPRDKTLVHIFQTHRGLWGVLDVIGQDYEATVYAVDVFRPLLAYSIAFWSQSHRSPSQHPYEFDSAVRVITLLSKSQILPAPLAHAHLMVTDLSPKDLTSILGICWDIFALYTIPPPPKPLSPSDIPNWKQHLKTVQGIVKRHVHLTAPYMGLFF